MTLRGPLYGEPGLQTELERNKQIVGETPVKYDSNGRVYYFDDKIRAWEHNFRKLISNG